MTTGDIITKMYEGDEESVIIVIAANKKWLGESSLGKQWGDFSIVGEQMSSSIYNLKKIEVLSNWTVEVVVNGTVEYVIDPMNMNYNEYNDIYHYDRDDWWSFNRLLGSKYFRNYLTYFCWGGGVKLYYESMVC